jgi:hypothetical protein
MRRASGAVIWLDLDLAGGDGAKERSLCGRSQLPADEVGRLGDDQRCGGERACRSDCARAGIVIGVGVVGGGEQNARVDD